MKINTVTQLMLFLLFVLTLNLWGFKTLLLLFSALLLLQVFLNNKHYYQLTKRFKWFYLMMFTIFVFNTPGEHISNWPFWLPPTFEGIETGLRQVIRIASILGVLSLILINNNKQQLISGVYFLIKPFAYFGLDMQRFSARLWLTLYYVESQQEYGNGVSTSKHISDRLNVIFAEDMHEKMVVELDSPAFTWVDVLAISCMLLVIAVVVWR